MSFLRGARRSFCFVCIPPSINTWYFCSRTRAEVRSTPQLVCFVSTEYCPILYAPFPTPHLVVHVLSTLRSFRPTPQRKWKAARMEKLWPICARRSSAPQFCQASFFLLPSSCWTRFLSPCLPFFLHTFENACFPLKNTLPWPRPSPQPPSSAHFTLLKCSLSLLVSSPSSLRPRICTLSI